MGRNKIRVPRFGMSVALTEGHVERGGGRIWESWTSFFVL